MTFYARNLPHWHPEGACIFLTWRLYGTLPGGTVTPDCAPASQASNLSRSNNNLDAETAGARFKRLDLQLDRAKIGPRWLADSRIARCIEDAMVRGEKPLEQYILHAYVVMPNHVHLLITPRLPVSRIMRGIKGVSARDANRILGRGGKVFWQDESYDHWVRDEKEFGKIRFYIEYNPVGAGLVKRPQDWQWSSASSSGRVQAFST
jgi:putative transposase